MNRFFIIVLLILPLSLNSCSKNSKDAKIEDTSIYNDIKVSPTPSDNINPASTNIVNGSVSPTNILITEETKLSEEEKIKLLQPTDEELNDKSENVDQQIIDPNTTL